MDIIEAIRDRTSIRAFLDRPVDKEVIHQIIDVARWGPSGANTQPWQVVVLTGVTKRQLGDALAEAHSSERPVNPDYKYYADHFPEPYRSRQWACGFALYASLGIQRNGREGRKAQWLKNYHGFGAPVELLFFIDSVLEKGSWLDMGMFIQNVMLASRGFGHETCPQASLAQHPGLVRQILRLPDSLLLVCGVALGYPDRNDPVNNYRTEREPVEGFTKWFD